MGLQGWWVGLLAMTCGLAIGDAEAASSANTASPASPASAKTATDAPARWILIDRLGEPADRAGHTRIEIDLARLERNGPWVHFPKRWITVRGSKRLDWAAEETYAVNCLTGARGTSRSTRPDSQGQIISVVTRTNEILEWSTPASIRLSPVANRLSADQRLMLAVCSCASATAVPPRVPAEAPGDDLGWHHESEWPPQQVEVMRTMKIGAMSALSGASDLSLNKLEDLRVEPAPALSAVAAGIEIFIRRARSCGWSY